MRTVGNETRKEDTRRLTKLDRRFGCPCVVARLGHFLDGNVEEGIGPAYSGQFFLDEMSVAGRRQRRLPKWTGQTRGSPCTHVVVPRGQRQTDAPESVERESGACVELVEDAGDVGWRWDELSASAWHGARPSSFGGGVV